jgi:hypothetical protein
MEGLHYERFTDNGSTTFYNLTAALFILDSQLTVYISRALKSESC